MSVHTCQAAGVTLPDSPVPGRVRQVENRCTKTESALTGDWAPASPNGAGEPPSATPRRESIHPHSSVWTVCALHRGVSKRTRASRHRGYSLAAALGELERRRRTLRTHNKGGVFESHDLLRATSLRNAIREFLEHHRHERNHQGVGNRSIDPQHHVDSLEDPVARRERLGTVL